MILHERLAAFFATLSSLLLTLLALQLTTAWGNLLAAAVIGYFGTLIAVTAKVRSLRPAAVMRATSRGAICGAVLTVLVLVGIVRSAAYVLGVS